MAQVSYGTITITDTNDIERIYVVYAKSSTNTNAPTYAASNWSETIANAPGSGDYVWQRTVIEQSGTHALSYGNPVCVTGPQGSVGEQGRGISSIVTTYCNYATGTPTASYNGWQSTVPTYDSTKPNYWVKTVITYTSGSPATNTSIYKDNGLTEAIAQSVQANQNAQNASTQAAAAQQQVTQLNSLLGGHFIYKSTSSGNSTPAGAGVIQNVADNPANWGYNTWIGANGIQLRRGETADATLNANGLILAKGGVEAGSKNTTNYIYIYSHDDATNHTLNINSSGNKSDWRIVAGKNFGVDKGGNLYASNVNISGLISATEGTIGGFTIEDDNIHNTKTSYSETTNNGIWLGTDGIGLGKGLFYVTNTGSLTAKSGTIGGFELSSTQLNAYGIANGPGTSSTGLYRVLLQSSPGTNGNNIAIGVATRASTSDSWSWQAYMNHSGYFSAQNANISGTITANSGTIGGWTVNSSYGIYTNSKTTTTSTNSGILIQKDGGIYAGAYSSSTAACPFQVTSAGVLTANSGIIAGWSFNTTSLYKNNATPGAASNTMVISTGTSSSNSIGGSTGPLSWMLSAGTGFGVTTEGVLYATGAKITGDVTVSKLTVSSGATINDTIGLISNDAVKVGGRNLLLNDMLYKDGSQDGITFTESSKGEEYVVVYGTATAAIDRPIADLRDIPITNTAVTISANYVIDGVTSGRYFGVSTTKNDSLYKTYGPIKWYSETEKRLTINLENGETLRYLRLYAPSGSELSATSYRFKIEIGNRQTDWTPAPEDVDKIIDSTSTSVTKYIDDKTDALNDTLVSIVGGEVDGVPVEGSLQTLEQQMSLKVNDSELQSLAAEMHNYLGEAGYMLIDNQALVITKQGETDNFAVIIRGDQIQFTQNGALVAYIKSDKLFIEQSEVVNSMKVGNFEWKIRNDGRLTLMHTGGNN